jgi:hypothetical protein
MKIEGQDFDFVDTLATPIAVADSWVKSRNKIGKAKGEAKLYIGNKDRMREFYGENRSARCFLLKKDLVAYMKDIKSEYMNPTQDYRGKENMAQLWADRMAIIEELPNVVMFTVHDQEQIEGPRGYLNSNDEAYSLMREIALPCVSYISTMHLMENQSDIFYWRLFVDDTEMDRRRDYVLKYGKKEDDAHPPLSAIEEKKIIEYRNARDGQGKYRERLLDECPFCPITMINEESLLIASHIKPWAVSDEKEKVDPKNGFILSPLYDKLFDRGFITFSTERHVHISNWLSRQDQKRIGITENQLFQYMPIDEYRDKYLEYHRTEIFKG